MKIKPLYLLIIGALGFLAYRFFQQSQGGVKPSGYSISTPGGGGSLTQDPLNGTINVQATIKKQAAKKKKTKVGKFLQKVGKPLAKVAVGYIPGVGPAISGLIKS